MRRDPKELERWTQSRDTQPDHTPEDTAPQSWDKLRTQIQQAIVRNCPPGNKTPKLKEP